MTDFNRYKSSVFIDTGHLQPRIDSELGEDLVRGGDLHKGARKMAK
jgi:hypothetical protein